MVTLKGDTLHGAIDYKDWGQNPKSISFKPQNDSQSRLLGTKDIQYFEVTGFENYHAYIVSISLGTTDLQNLSAIADTSSKTDDVFLKLLQHGKNISVFSYYDGLKTRFYVLDNTMAVPQELLYRLSLNPNDKSNVVTRKIYQSQLNAIAEANHMTVADQVSRIQYTQQDILKITAKINGGETFGIAKEAQKNSPVRFFAGIGAADNTLKYSGDKNAIPLAGSSSNATSPEVNIGIDAYLNPSVGTIVFRASLSASLSSYNLSQTNVSNLTSTNETVSQQVKQVLISVSPQFIYNFYNTAPLKIYVDAGLAVNIASYPTNEYKDQTSGFGGQTMNDFPMLQGFFVSFPVRV